MQARAALVGASATSFRWSLRACTSLALVTSKRTRHLPVLEDGRLIGMVSIGDLVRATISEQRFIIEQLEHHITDTRVQREGPHSA